MSKEEFERAMLMRQVHERRLTQRKAAEVLGLSLRQVERLYRVYKGSGPAGLASRKRGRPSNRKLSDGLRRSALGLIQQHYAGFGPTLANEKLRELHGLSVSTETLRQWMTEAELWVPHLKRRERIQQPRRRRDCVGELIQIDGCDHDWFEERAGRCVLLVFVDDATSRIMELHFCESEATFEYFEAIRSYLLRHGKPVAFYSDKASIFRINRPEPKAGEGITQFGRAMSDLNIDIICANTAAAKGRVERAHQTLQDRLVKELRLRGISSIEAANAYAEEYREEYNRKFSKAPRHAFNAHRPLLDTDDLEDVFQWKEQRKVSKKLTIHFKNVMYLLENSKSTRHLAGKQVTVYEDRDGAIRVHDGMRFIPATPFPKLEARVTQGAIVSNKMLSGALEAIKETQALKDEEKLQHLKTKRERRLFKKRAANVA